MHDVTVLDYLPIEPGAFYVMDRGTSIFNAFTGSRPVRVLRDASQTQPRFHSSCSSPGDKTTGLRSDQTIVLVDPVFAALSRPVASHCLLRVENARRFVFLTNNFALPALAIALLSCSELNSSPSELRSSNSGSPFHWSSPAVRSAQLRFGSIVILTIKWRRLDWSENAFP